MATKLTGDAAYLAKHVIFKHVIFKRYLVAHHLSKDGESIWTLHYETPGGNVGKILYQIDEEEAEWEAEYEPMKWEEHEARIKKAEDEQRRFLESLTEYQRQQYEREWEATGGRLSEIFAHSRKWHPERW